MRALLAEGDALAKTGDYGPAVRRYAEVARAYAQEGFSLKAIAVWKQVREIIRAHAPSERELDAEARRQLPLLYRELGLLEDASAIENERD